ncbi:MAG: hypothetical protein CMH32_01095 [Micavibrio sp.]|nr:hypothetical protein [Micavibrio sp.]HCK32826.1 hypothetical protein [Rhodospirillaceae bacterium]
MMDMLLLCEPYSIIFWKLETGCVVFSSETTGAFSWAAAGLPIALAPAKAINADLSPVFKYFPAKLTF